VSWSRELWLNTRGEVVWYFWKTHTIHVLHTVFGDTERKCVVKKKTPTEAERGLYTPPLALESHSCQLYISRKKVPTKFGVESGVVFYLFPYVRPDGVLSASNLEHHVLVCILFWVRTKERQRHYPMSTLRFYHRTLVWSFWTTDFSLHVPTAFIFFRHRSPDILPLGRSFGKKRGDCGVEEEEYCEDHRAFRSPHSYAEPDGHFPSTQ
jgi:hypothetical protein